MALISLRGAGKRYQKLEEQAMLLRTLIPLKPPVRGELWALRDINFELAAGETVGVMGHNGAGKTTMLRLLAGVTRPTVGRVQVEGRIAPLISLGIGFHEELSGRENVLVNGMLLGLSAKEVSQRFDQIVEFSELERFIDTPVKFYSSGMFMRLGFAVVAHIDPQILLLDEVLAVGDARFQVKCFNRLRDLQEQGAAILMVSHSIPAIRQLCGRAIVLRNGRLDYDGKVEDAVAVYERDPSRGTAREETETEDAVEIVESEFIGTVSREQHVSYDEPIELRLRLRFHQRTEDPVLYVGLITVSGQFAGFDSTLVGRTWRTFECGEEVTVHIKFRARLGGGAYHIIVDIKNREGAKRLARADDLVLAVEGRTGSAGIADVRAEIELAGSESSR